MESTSKTQALAQVVDMSDKDFRKNTRKFPKRITARHLSDDTRSEIAELFCVHECHDSVAAVMRQRGLKGITGKTVAEVVDLLHIRKMVQSERRSVSMPGYREVRGAA